MDIRLDELDERTRFEVKLQIALYNTALKVMDEKRKEEFEFYMQERVEKIKNILDAHGAVRIFENGKLIFEG